MKYNNASYFMNSIIILFSIFLIILSSFFLHILGHTGKDCLEKNSELVGDDKLKKPI